MIHLVSQSAPVNTATIEGILAFSSTLGLASLILYGLTMDRLVRMLHEHHKAIWNDLGRPVGILYVPHNARWSEGMIAHLRLVCDGLFKTPEWLADNAELLFLVKKIRWCLALAVLSLIVALVLPRIAPLVILFQTGPSSIPGLVRT